MSARLPARLALWAGLAVLAGCATSTPALAPGQTFPVFFTNASVQPDVTAHDVITQAATWATRYPTEAIRVTGYADPRSPATEAAHLSTHRADAIAAALEAAGIAPSRIHRATGDEALIGYSGVGNRRVDIAVGM